MCHCFNYAIKCVRVFSTSALVRYYRQAGYITQEFAACLCRNLDRAIINGNSHMRLSCLQADLWLKSGGLVKRRLALLCIHRVNWVNSRNDRSRSHDYSTINVVLVLKKPLSLLIIPFSFSWKSHSSQFSYPVSAIKLIFCSFSFLFSPTNHGFHLRSCQTDEIS